MGHDLNILMIFGIKEKSIILTHAVYWQESGDTIYCDTVSKAIFWDIA